MFTPPVGKSVEANIKQGVYMEIVRMSTVVQIFLENDLSNLEFMTHSVNPVQINLNENVFFF